MPFRVDPDLSVRQRADGFGLTNGPCFSPDGATLYVNDSWTKRVYAFDFDVSQGLVSNRRILTTFEVDEGATGPAIPDRATVDEDGGIWIAGCLTGGGRRYAPDASLGPYGLSASRESYKRCIRRP